MLFLAHAMTAGILVAVHFATAAIAEFIKGK